MEKVILPHKVKILFFCAIFIPVFVLISFMAYGLWFDPKHPKEYYLDEKKNIDVQSKIKFIFRDKKNHNIQFLKLKDTLLSIPSTWEDKFQVGDSVYKRKGTLKLTQYRNGKIIEIFDYTTVMK